MYISLKVVRYEYHVYVFPWRYIIKGSETYRIKVASWLHPEESIDSIIATVPLLAAVKHEMQQIV